MFNEQESLLFSSPLADIFLTRDIAYDIKVMNEGRLKNEAVHVNDLRDRKEAYDEMTSSALQSLR